MPRSSDSPVSCACGPARRSFFAARHGYARAATVAFFVVLGPVALAAQQASGNGDGSSDGAPAEAVAARVDAPPMVDGVLDDAAWEGGQAMSGFIQREPSDGEPASEPTEVRVLFDADALYVGVWLYDSEPAQIVDGEAIRDAQLQDSDAVVFVLDTFRDEQNGFVFGTNPAGIEYDGQLSNEGQGGGRFGGGGGGGGGGFRQRSAGGALGGLNVNWDGSWQVATSRDTRGWYAEFRIPFTTLRYAAGEGLEWGFNVSRRIRRHNEESTWAPVPRQFNVYRLQYAGTLSGLEPPAARVARVTPYVLANTARDYGAGDNDFATTGDWGADGKVQLTQGLTLDLTVNTDFAQVEVDEAQTNLTRFSLFFPEKRPFFLENAGFFSVGGGDAQLFFSRRIGISSGQQVPIDGGGRLSGRFAGLNVGLLHIRTGDAGDLSGDDFSVARVAKELPNRSRVGVSYMGRDAVAIDGDHNRTYALDGTVGIGDAITLSSYAARTETPGLDGRDHVFDIQAAYADREWSGSIQHRQAGEHFNPEVGFAPRTGYRSYSGVIFRYIRPENISWIRELRPHISYNTYRSIEDGFEQSARLHVDSHVDSPSGYHFGPAFNWIREGLEEPFEISEGVVVLPGTYDGWEAGWRFNTNESARVSFNGFLNWGSFLSGNRRGGGATITYRGGARLTSSLRYEYNDVELPEGNFTATLAALAFGYFFNPNVYLQSLLQYSDQIDTWSANVRFGWLTTAGTGLFVVYNGSQGFDSLAGPQGRSLIIKFTRQFDVARW